MTALFSKPGAKLILVVALQCLVLLAVIGFKQYTVITGETVVLKTAPIDPRDLFRGDYVTMRYDISQIDASSLAGDADVYDEAYVELREGADGYWDAVAIHNNREHSFDDSVLIKGDVTRTYSPRSSGTYVIKYGIEEIFIPEGSGAALRSGPERPLAVKVKVDRFGNAIARELLSDGDLTAPP